MKTAQTVNKKLAAKIKNEINDIVEKLDTECADSFSDQDLAYLMDDMDGQLIDNFIRNANIYRRSQRAILNRLGEEYDEYDDGQAIIRFFENKGFYENEIADMLKEYSVVSLTDSFVYEPNEIWGMPFGEKEYEIDTDQYPDLKDLLSQATAADLRDLDIKDPDSFLAYGRPGERLIFTVDMDRFLSYFSEFLADGEKK